jgi:hypothetical protein
VLSVVGRLQFDGRDVAAVLVEAAMVEPVNPFGGGHLDVLDGAPRLGGLISSVLYRPLIVSANALSYELPTAPTEGWIPACARRSLNRIDVY